MAPKLDVKELLASIPDILGLGPKNVIGLDIGVHSVKVCEISAGRNSFKLNKFASVSLSEGAIIEDEIIKPEDIVEAINRAFKSAGIANKQVCIGISGQNTMTKRLQLPPGSEEDIEDQVMWESEQYIPFGIDDSSVVYHVIGENPGGGIDVIIAAARNDLVQGYSDLAKQAGLKVKIVDLNIFSLCNLFEFVKGDEIENVEEGVLIIDFGAQTTTMMIYKNNSLIFTREMNIGGSMVTEEIQRQMGLNYVEAEDLKTMGDESGNLPEEIVEIIEIVLESFVVEIKKTLNFFMTASSEDTIEVCYVTGGSSLIPGLNEGLQAALEFPVKYLNPFEKVDFNSRAFDDDSLANIASIGCTAIGLGMRKLR